MEIRNLSQEEEQKLCRLRDMIVLALSGDGILSAEEELCIKTVMTMKSIKLDYVELVLSDPFAIKDSYPTTHKDQASTHVLKSSLLRPSLSEMASQYFISLMGHLLSDIISCTMSAKYSSFSLCVVG